MFLIFLKSETFNEFWCRFGCAFGLVWHPWVTLGCFFADFGDHFSSLISRSLFGDVGDRGAGGSGVQDGGVNPSEIPGEGILKENLKRLAEG